MEATPTPSGALPPAATYKLYTPQMVSLATFLGSPLAGAMLMWMNYRRLGKQAAAMGILAFGIVLTVVLIAIGFAMTNTTSSGSFLYIVPIIVMFSLAKGLQGPTVEQHVNAGGPTGSWGIAAGLGVAGLVVILGVVFAIAFAITPSLGTRLAVDQSEIYYSGTATEADAKALAKALQDLTYFNKTDAKTVFLSKGTDGTVIKFVVKDADTANKPEIVTGFTQITTVIAPSVGGLPITLKLIDPELKELKSQVVKAAP